MRALKALVLGVVTAAALWLAVPAVAADAPCPMNPFPGQSQEYAFNLQTLFGHGSKVRPAVYCADSSVFRRGQQVVFRLYITDAKTGKVMTGKDMSKVVVRIAGLPDQKMALLKAELEERLESMRTHAEVGACQEQLAPEMHGVCRGVVQFEGHFAREAQPEDAARHTGVIGAPVMKEGGTINAT